MTEWYQHGDSDDSTVTALCGDSCQPYLARTRAAFGLLVLGPVGLHLMV